MTATIMVTNLHMLTNLQLKMCSYIFIFKVFLHFMFGSSLNFLLTIIF